MTFVMEKLPQTAEDLRAEHGQKRKGAYFTFVTDLAGVRVILTCVGDMFPTLISPIMRNEVLIRA
jgi:hypothetical protein